MVLFRSVLLLFFKFILLIFESLILKLQSKNLNLSTETIIGIYNRTVCNFVLYFSSQIITCARPGAKEAKKRGRGVANILW